MKKMSLVLCACAVAMAGLLASCSNGPEEVVFDTYETTRYMYDVSGSFTRLEKSGLADAVTTTTKKETITNGFTAFRWESKTPENRDTLTYYLDDCNFKVKRSDVSTPSSGDPTTTTYSDFYDSLWWVQAWNTTITSLDGNNGFSKVGNKYYARVNAMSWGDDYVVGEITLSADPATSDTFTLSFSATDDQFNTDADDDGTVDYYNQTTWSCSLTFTKKAEN
ncbi:MAG: hypothetical protein J6J00_06440 [Treponema sp.]|nr:hypothetical protein [Treponema sp.]